jgi:hypothetical protein
MSSPRGGSAKVAEAGRLAASGLLDLAVADLHSSCMLSWPYLLLAWWYLELLGLDVLLGALVAFFVSSLLACKRNSICSALFL